MYLLRELLVGIMCMSHYYYNLDKIQLSIVYNQLHYTVQESDSIFLHLMYTLISIPYSYNNYNYYNVYQVICSRGKFDYHSVDILFHLDSNLGCRSYNYFLLSCIGSSFGFGTEVYKHFMFLYILTNIVHMCYLLGNNYNLILYK